MNQHHRQPYVAGKLYPADTEILSLQIASLSASAVQKKVRHVKAIITPHAGLMYSGKVAASVFNQIDADARYQRVFIIGSSHHEIFEKATLFNDGHFIMPYGIETVDTDFCNELAALYPDIFVCNADSHLREHSIEIQLPFLHFALRHPFKIVPILIGTLHSATCARIASVLKSYFTANNLFIISSNFSHYLPLHEATLIDHETKNAILSNKPETLLNTLAALKNLHSPNLVTGLCGWNAVLTLLYLTTGNDQIKYYDIDYGNSGESEYNCNPKRVVGYRGIAVAEHMESKIEAYCRAEASASLPERSIHQKDSTDFCKKIQEAATIQPDRSEQK